MNKTAQSKVLKMRPQRSDSTKSGARVVLTPSSSLLDENMAEVRDMVRGALDHGKSEIILDLKGATFIDSDGLEFLVDTEAELRKSGGILKIVHLNPVCTDILIATRLMNIFSVFKDVHEAMKNNP